MRMHSKVVLAAISAAVLGASAANAAPIIYTTSTALDVLVAGAANGDGIVQGDKLFFNFGYSYTGDMPTSDDVNVLPITDLDGNYGIRFQGAFLDNAGGGASDALITYSVLVLDPAFQISDAHIAGNTAVFGTGSITVTESWVPDIGDATIKIYEIKPGGTDLLDSIIFNETYTLLHVQKDILAHVTGETGVANLSFVDQTFSQVPEPASLGVLALGGAALLLRRKKA